MELGDFLVLQRCEFCNCTAGGGHVMSGKWLNEPRTSLKVKLPFENLPRHGSRLRWNLDPQDSSRFGSTLIWFGFDL